MTLSVSETLLPQGRPASSELNMKKDIKYT